MTSRRKIKGLTLTERQRVFAQLIYKGLTPTDAARQAGYSQPSNNASRLVNSPRIQQELERLARDDERQRAASDRKHPKTTAETLRQMLEVTPKDLLTFDRAGLPTGVEPWTNLPTAVADRVEILEHRALEGFYEIRCDLANPVPLLRRVVRAEMKSTAAVASYLEEVAACRRETLFRLDDRGEKIIGLLDFPNWTAPQLSWCRSLRIQVRDNQEGPRVVRNVHFKPVATVEVANALAMTRGEYEKTPARTTTDVQVLGRPGSPGHDFATALSDRSHLPHQWQPPQTGFDLAGVEVGSTNEENSRPSGEEASAYYRTLQNSRPTRKETDE